MEKLFKPAIALLPMLFAIGFLVPLITQAVATLRWQPPLGLSDLTFALILGGGWGLIAQVTGRWV